MIGKPLHQPFSGAGPTIILPLDHLLEEVALAKRPHGYRVMRYALMGREGLGKSYELFSLVHTQPLALLGLVDQY